VTVFEKTPICQALANISAIGESAQNDNQLQLFNL
jgi:hypothetical protein